ncbi:MAG: polymer-forming cytoskeletal protein, partial [Sphingomonadales bacterium]
APAGAPSIIGADVNIRGDVTANGEVQLDGKVEGDVHCTSLTIGDNGEVTGSISAESVVVRGTVTGQINARSVRLEKACRVKGDLYHETVSVEAGAVIEGHFINNTNAGRATPAPMPEKRHDPAVKVVAGSATTNSDSKPDTPAKTRETSA